MLPAYSHQGMNVHAVLCAPIMVLHPVAYVSVERTYREVRPHCENADMHESHACEFTCTLAVCM